MGNSSESIISDDHPAIVRSVIAKNIFFLWIKVIFGKNNFLFTRYIYMHILLFRLFERKSMKLRHAYKCMGLYGNLTFFLITHSTLFQYMHVASKMVVL